VTVYYKATQPDGTDFRTGTVDYAGALASGDPVMHPDPFWDDAAGYLSISVEPAETLIGGSWPCRLFEVEPVGEVRTAPGHPYKRAVTGLRMVREVEAWRALGPRGESVAEFIARTSAGDAAWDAAWTAAWTAGDAAGALLVRDRISPEQFRMLTEPWKILTGEEL